MQGLHAVSRGELEIRHGPNKVASARRSFEGITAAVTHNSPLLRKIQEIGSSSLAMAKIRRHYVLSDDLDKQAYLQEHINAEMVEGEEPALYFERMSIIREKLAEVGTHKTDQGANLHILQCLTSDFEVDKKIRQQAPNLTLTMIEDRVRITYRELEASKKKVVDGSGHIVVATGGGGSGGHGKFPTPGHCMAGGLSLIHI